MNYIQLAVHLTETCNLNCSYCGVYNKNDSKSCEPKPLIKPEIIERAYNMIRKESPKAHIGFLCLGKGEPLMNWEAIEKIDEIKEKDENVTCFIATNGTFQNKVLDLAERKRWVVQISYDGIHHDKQRDKKEVVEDTLRKISKIKGANYLIRMTLTPTSLENMSDSLRFIKDSLGARFVVFGPAISFGRYKDEPSFLDNKENVKKMVEAIKFARQIGLSPLCSIQKPCSLATKGYYLMPDGKLSICYLKYTPPSEELRKKARKEGCLLKPLV